MTFRTSALALAVMCATTPAGASDVLGSYYAAFGPQDYWNSSGKPLTDFVAVLQQDRANFHRFNNRDRYDDDDPFFSNREMRAAIPALFAAGGNDGWAGPVSPPAWDILDADVIVFICGAGGRVTHLIVDNANGDGYSGC